MNHHKENTYCVSDGILDYLVQQNIQPLQNVNDFDDDGYILYWAIKDLDNENIALDILNLLSTERVSCSIEMDDEDNLRQYLHTQHIITDLNCDLANEMQKHGFNKWENYCHFTNMSILMYCIKKRWNMFCLRLLDFNDLARIKKQNVTNAYEMSIKYDLHEVTEKIQRCTK